MKKRTALFFSLFISCLVFAQSKPNIVFILTDDLCYCDIAALNNDIKEEQKAKT